MRACATCLILFGLASCAPERDSPTRATSIKLFDGKTLDGWREINFEFGGGAEAFVAGDGSLNLGAGEPIAGIALDNPNIKLPDSDYEIELEAKIIDGDDFFCGLTIPFPSQSSHCTLIVGGWGGTVVGISNINGMDASINPTRYDRPFKPQQWYHIRARVTAEFIDVWIDGTQVIELEIRDRKIAMRPGAIEQCKPLGIATWQTAAAYRNLRLRPL